MPFSSLVQMRLRSNGRLVIEDSKAGLPMYSELFVVWIFDHHFFLPEGGRAHYFFFWFKTRVVP